MPAQLFSLLAGLQTATRARFEAWKSAKIVHARQEKIYSSFLFYVSQTGEERDITHMQYCAWPDHGVPSDWRQFATFTERVRAARTGIVEPAVVHCSAGIGRTGVLVLMETALCLVEANQPVYPLDIVRSMRDQRAMMIQNAVSRRLISVQFRGAK